MDGMPYEHGALTALVLTSNQDGVVSDGFGVVRVRALEGRAFALEITEELSGLTIVAQLDCFRGARARVKLQRDALIAAIQAASKEDGLPVPFPQPA